eukprot:6213113-Pleurochrysis_carterae.AAC.2
MLGSVVPSATAVGGTTSSESAAPVKSSMYICRYTAAPAAPRLRGRRRLAGPLRAAPPSGPPPEDRGAARRTPAVCVAPRPQRACMEMRSKRFGANAPPNPCACPPPPLPSRPHPTKRSTASIGPPSGRGRIYRQTQHRLRTATPSASPPRPLPPHYDALGVRDARVHAVPSPVAGVRSHAGLRVVLHLHVVPAAPRHPLPRLHDDIARLQAARDVPEVPRRRRHPL